MKATAVTLLVLVMLSGLPAGAQSVISAQSGLINFTQGRVLLNDRPVMQAFGQLPQMKEQQTLHTVSGRAELLLNPGVFLRVGEGSSVRMVSGQLTASKLELVSGTVVLEAAEVRKDNAVSLRYRDATISVLKRGLYRLETDPARLRVFEGKALVESGGRRVEVGKGKAMAFDGSLAVAKFDRKEADALDLWSSRRAAYLARVNYSTASMLRDGSWSNTSGWWWNPYFGAYTFMPMGGIAYSPYGFYYWNPNTVRQPYANSGGGGSYQASSMSSGSSASSSPMSAPGSATSLGSSSGRSISVGSTMSAPSVPGTASSGRASSR